MTGKSRPSSSDSEEDSERLGRIGEIGGARDFRWL